MVNKMTKQRTDYINKLKQRHECKIHINGSWFKRHDRFTNKVMFEFNWNVTNKIKYEQLIRIV